MTALVDRAEATRIAKLTGLTYHQAVVLGKLHAALKDSELDAKGRAAVVTVLLALEAGRTTVPE